MDGEKEEVARRCRLSDPVHPHTLSRRDNPRPSLCFSCGPKGEQDEDFNFGNFYYNCDICKVVFHPDCYMLPRGTRHPYHPNHPLYFTIRFSETRIQSFKTDYTGTIDLLKDEPSFDSHKVYETNNACDWCGNVLGPAFFHCPDCNFSLDGECARVDPPFTITNSERHEHPLTLFPRLLEESCSVCGLVGDKETGYACDPCKYLIHQKCLESSSVVDIQPATSSSP